MLYFWAAVAVLFGVLRFVLPAEGGINQADIYKDLAHLLVGGFFGAYFASKRNPYLVLALALTALEVVAFFVRHK